MWGGLVKGRYTREKDTGKDGGVDAKFTGTPSDWRALKNLLAQLKRQGFIWPWPPQKGKEKK